MTDAELNRRLFDVLLPNIFPGDKHAWEQNGDSVLVWVSGKKAETIKHFSPATSSDHLRLYVLPEIERRGLITEFLTECPEGMWETLTASPAVLSAAALKVLR